MSFARTKEVCYSVGRERNETRDMVSPRQENLEELELALAASQQRNDVLRHELERIVTFCEKETQDRESYLTQVTDLNQKNEVLVARLAECMEERKVYLEELHKKESELRDSKHEVKQLQEEIKQQLLKWSAGAAVSSDSSQSSESGQGGAFGEIREEQ